MPDLNLFGYTNKEIAFLFVWLTTLIIPMACGLKNISRDHTSHTSLIQETDNGRKTPWQNHVKFYLLPMVFFALFIFYTYLILDGADLVGNDYSQITLHTVRDRLFHMPIWERAGRFWPLGFQEFNFVSLLGKDPVIYFSVSVLQLLGVLFCLFIILWNFHPRQTILTVLLVIVTPSFVKTYFNLIYPERNIIFWLAIFVVSIQSWEKSRSCLGFCMTLVAAQFSLYYKEPIFVLISSFSILRLALAYLRTKKEQRYIHRWNFIREQWLDLSLLTLSLTFLLLYLVFVLPGIETSYNAKRSLDATEFDIFLRYIQVDPLLSVLILFFLLRVIFLALKKRAIDSVWDPLAVGSILYFLAYVRLQLDSWYYMAPVNFIGILYVSWIAHRILRPQRNKLVPLIIGVLFCAIFIYNLDFSSAYILELKKTWDGRNQLATFLRNYEPDKNTESIEVFFPSTRNYQVKEVATFLDYKGVPLYPENHHEVSVTKQTNIPLKIITLGGGSCGRRYRCYEADELRTGNLIVIMPDRGRRIIDVLQDYETGFNLLFHYQPEFSDIEKLLLFLSNFREIPDKDIYVLIKN